ncbi:hypothetical protein [Kinneretia aquatilis]|uniref:hypothetical protein n=1 Tax=Kinneretia aquatilis TaxID=2070761 RepID=UPI0014950A8C|nr:hypothetical protein [Paucibacter aquatile]WIV98334.1 hypothetical protein K9V56_002140 [Paucibacter aquatile]
MKFKLRGAAVLLVFAPLLSLAQPVNPAIPRGKYTPERQMEIINEANAATGKIQKCINEYIASYQESLLKHCVATDGGKGIGGGCEHVAYAYSVHERVIELALQRCKAAPKSKPGAARPN